MSISDQGTRLMRLVQAAYLQRDVEFVIAAFIRRESSF
jgi:hypothetical protein